MGRYREMQGRYRVRVQVKARARVRPRARVKHEGAAEPAWGLVDGLQRAAHRG